MSRRGLFRESGRRFVLDTNILIEAQNRYYAMDLCPGFWNCLLHFHQVGRVLGIDKVLKEIRTNNDELIEWIREAPATLFATTGTQDIGDAYREFVDWVWAHDQYQRQAKVDFARAADGWVAAYAKVDGAAVVTHEAFSAGAKRVVPLPNLCAEFGIDCLHTFDMLRELGVSFDWSGRP